jgi:hypothetical protein
MTLLGQRILSEMIWEKSRKLFDSGGERGGRYIKQEMFSYEN